MQDSGSDPVEKYKLKVKNEDGKEHEEEVDIDTEKETERFHVPKTSSDNDEADILFDFKKVNFNLSKNNKHTKHQVHKSKNRNVKFINQHALSRYVYNRSLFVIIFTASLLRGGGGRGEEEREKVKRKGDGKGE